MSNVLKEKELGENSVVQDFLTTGAANVDGTGWRNETCYSRFLKKVKL